MFHKGDRSHESDGMDSQDLPQLCVSTFSTGPSGWGTEIEQPKRPCRRHLIHQTLGEGMINHAPTDKVRVGQDLYGPDTVSGGPSLRSGSSTSLLTYSLIFQTTHTKKGGGPCDPPLYQSNKCHSVALIPFRYELITVAKHTVMSLGLDAPELNPDFHADFDFLNIAVGHLRHQTGAVGQLGNRQPIG